MLTAQVRVMPTAFFALQRLFVRVDDVLVRVIDTRVWYRFGAPTVIREQTHREQTFEVRLSPPFWNVYAACTLPACCSFSMKVLRLLSKFKMSSQALLSAPPSSFRVEIILFSYLMLTECTPDGCTNDAGVGGTDGHQRGQASSIGNVPGRQDSWDCRQTSHHEGWERLHQNAGMTTAHTQHDSTTACTHKRYCVCIYIYIKRERERWRERERERESTTT